MCWLFEKVYLAYVVVVVGLSGPHSVAEFIWYELLPRKISILFFPLAACLLHAGGRRKTSAVPRGLAAVQAPLDVLPSLLSSSNVREDSTGRQRSFPGHLR